VPPHQHDRLVSAFLEQPQQHDADEAADVQAVCGTVVADVTGYASAAESLIERLEIGALMDEAAFDCGRKKCRARR